MTQTLTEMCRQLRLAHVTEALEIQKDEQLIRLAEEILTAELEGRKRSKLNKLVHQAMFPHLKTFDGYQYGNIGFPASCNRDKLQSLEWIEKKENILMLGAVGTGKTHMAIALGVLARFQAKLKKAELLILDEVGYVPFSQTGSELLFNVIADCYEQQSVIVTSNLEFGQWTSIFGDNKLTAALIDRLVHHAHILTFTGDSFRLKEAMNRT